MWDIAVKQEETVKESLPQILRSRALKQYQFWADRSWEMKEIWTSLDAFFGYTDDTGTAMNYALSTAICNDKWTDSTNVSIAYENWIKIEDRIKGWSAEKLVFEVMKGQVIGRESRKFVSEMEECTISEFFAQIYKFMRMRNPHKPVNTTRHLEESRQEVYTVTVSDKRERNRDHNWKSKRRISVRGYEELWEALCKKRKIPNSEANKMLAKSRFDAKTCLYCGNGTHSGFTCRVPEKASGYFRNSK